MAEEQSQPTEIAATSDPVRICAARNDWPQRFAAERQRLLDAFPQFRAIEHFGSTAVPGLAAKPIVDMLAGLTTFAEAEQLREPLALHDYQFAGSYTRRLYFVKRLPNGERAFHLHLVKFAGSVWQTRLKFRDALRSNAVLRQRYLAQKQLLAKRFPDDMRAYAEHKGAYIQQLLRQLESEHA